MSEADAEDSESKADAQSKKDEEILELARERFEKAKEFWTPIYDKALEDVKFSVGEQWDEEVKTQRKNDKRPCLTVNRIPQYIHSITNDQRQNRPSIKVSPVDDKADVETAKVLQGLIRHIENDSNAETAYTRGLDGSVRKSFGFWRVVPEYCDPSSFKQQLKIQSIRNHFSVFLDPTIQQPDGSDAGHGFIISEYSKSEYKAQFGDTEISSERGTWSLIDGIRDWVRPDTVQVAEYFYREYVDVDLVLLSSGETMEKAAFDASVKETIGSIQQQAAAAAEVGQAFEYPALPEVIRTRRARQIVIHWLKINGAEILERTTFPGQYIPIIMCIGEEVDVNGKLILESATRHTMDSQRMYNYFVSSEVETIALAPKAPFVGVEGQFTGYENEWRQANVKNYAYLQYKDVTTVSGQQAPPPQRQYGEPPIAAITNARSNAAEDMKATTGQYDAALGMRSNEKSGIAIQRRTNQSQTNNYHFIGNFNLSLRHTGRILVDAIPIVYDTAQAIRILGEDDSVEMVTINEMFKDKKTGQQRKHDFSIGKYDVAIETGPSFATKRQEATETMVSLTQSVPQIGQVAADLIVKNMDLPGAQELSERLRKTLPAGIAEPKDGEKQPVPPEIQQKLTQYEQLIDQLTEQLKSASGDIKTKRMELESKERIANLQEQVKLEMKLADLGSKEALHLLNAELAQIESRMNMLKQNEPIEPETVAPQGQPAPMAQDQQSTGGFPPG